MPEIVEEAKEAEPVTIVSSQLASQIVSIMLTKFSYSDIKCFNTFYKIAKKNNRSLIVSLKQAYLLNALRSGK